MHTICGLKNATDMSRNDHRLKRRANLSEKHPDNDLPPKTNRKTFSLSCVSFFQISLMISAVLVN